MSGARAWACKGCSWTSPTWPTEDATGDYWHRPKVARCPECGGEATHRTTRGKPEAMRPVHLVIDADVLVWLTELAQARGVDRTVIIRQALSTYVGASVSREAEFYGSATRLFSELLRDPGVKKAVDRYVRRREKEEAKGRRNHG